MKTQIPKDKLQELIKLAESSDAPIHEALKGQGEAALILKNKGFGVRQIARFLSENGIPISATAVSKFLNSQPKLKI
jgi:precorrin-6B methylase 1